MRVKKVLICSALLVFCLCGCNNNDVKETEKEVITHREDKNVYGAELVKFYDIYDSDYAYPYEVPIITGYEIKEFSVEGYETKGDYNENVEFVELSDGIEYNGWNYYIAYFDVKLNDDEQINFDVESINMCINTETVSYRPAKFHIANVKSEYNGEYNVEYDSLFYANGGPVKLTGAIVKGKKESVSFEALHQCSIDEIGYADFISLDNFEILKNEEPIGGAFPIELNEGDIVTINYDMNYETDETQNDEIKTTFLARYRIENKKDLFVDTQSIVVVNMADDRFIKDYVDEKLN